MIGRIRSRTRRRWRILPQSYRPSLLVVLVLALLVQQQGVRAGQGGGMWTSAKIATRDLNGVAFPSPQRGWAVGAAGVVLASADGGASWNAQTSGTSSDLHDVSFTDSRRGWAVGASDTVLRTTDGGSTWERGTTGIGGALLRSIDSVDALYGWIAGNTTFPNVGNVVAATTDGGSTWKRQSVPAGIGLLDISFVGRKHGFVTGFSGAAYRTSDGGATWVPMVVAADGVNVQAVLRADEQLGFAAAHRRLLRTTDGGHTWTVVMELDGAVQDLTYADGVVLAAGEKGLILRSSDAGESWEADSSATSANLTAVDAPTSSFAAVVGAAGTLTTYRAEAVPVVPLDIDADAERCVDLVGERQAPAFTTRWSHAAAGYQTKAVRTDVSGDGTDDIVMLGPEGVVALRPGLPTAEAVLWERPFQALPSGLILADTDGDGRDEIVVAARRSRQSRSGIAVLDAATGDDVWSRRLSDGASQVRAADVTGDGADDLVVVTAGNALRVLSGDTGADMRSPRALGAQPTHLQVGDLAGDGAPDAVVALTDGRVVAVDLVPNTMHWTYRVEEGRLESVALAEVTGDGVVDVVAGGSGIPASLTSDDYDRTTSVGTRTGPVVVAIDGRTGDRIWDWGVPKGGTARVGAITTGDLTGDDIPDVIAHVFRLGTAHLIALDGRGNAMIAGAREPTLLWSRSTTLGSGAQGPYGPDSLVAGDGDGDGLSDAYLSAWTGALVAVSGGRVQPVGLRDPDRPEALFEIPRRPPHPVVSFSHEASGPELLSASGDHLVALRDPSSGEALWEFDAGGRPAIAAGALASDGRPGLAVASDAGRIYGLDGAGELLEGSADVFLPERTVGVAAVDVTGDGVDEAVAASRDGTVVAVDPRTSTRLWTVELEGTPTAVTGLDDGRLAVGSADGRVTALDAATGAVLWQHEGTGAVTDLEFVRGPGVLVAGDATGGLRLLARDGSLHAETSTDSGSVTAIAPADLDGNGRNEFAVAAGAAFYGFSISGERSWKHSVGIAASFIAAGDLDGDGTDEVVGTSMDAQARAMDGRTGAARWAVPNGWPGPVAVADLEGDGRAEAIVTTPAPGDARGSVRTIDAGGTVLARCTPNKAPHSAHTVDLDRDGTQEVVVGMEAGDVYVFGGPALHHELDVTSVSFTDSFVAAGQYSDEVLFEARLTDQDGVAIANAELTFELEGDGGARAFAAITDQFGIAAVTPTLLEMPGAYRVTARFAGDESRSPSAVAGSFIVEKEDTTTELTVSGRGRNTTLEARLSDFDDPSSLVSGRIVYFYSDSELIGSAETGSDGIATLVIPPGHRGANRTYEAIFEGDDWYRGSHQRSSRESE